MFTIHTRSGMTIEAANLALLRVYLNHCVNVVRVGRVGG